MIFFFFCAIEVFFGHLETLDVCREWHSIRACMAPLSPEARLSGLCVTTGMNPSQQFGVVV